MTRVVRSALFVFCAGLALAPAGCGNSRPPGVATQPGDSYIELTDLTGESDGTEIRLRVHYRFPDGLPHPDTWFKCCFEVNGGSSGTAMVIRQGRALDEEGDIVTTTNKGFVRLQRGTFGALMKQSKSQNGPWHDVSGKIVVDF